jgi:hypothetical protein
LKWTLECVEVGYLDLEVYVKNSDGMSHREVISLTFNVDENGLISLKYGEGVLPLSWPVEELDASIYLETEGKYIILKGITNQDASDLVWFVDSSMIRF